MTHVLEFSVPVQVALPPASAAVAGSVAVVPPVIPAVAASPVLPVAARLPPGLVSAPATALAMPIVADSVTTDPRYMHLQSENALLQRQVQVLQERLQALDSTCCGCVAWVWRRRLFVSGLGGGVHGVVIAVALSSSRVPSPGEDRYGDACRTPCFGEHVA